MNVTELRIGNWVKTCTPNMEIMIPDLNVPVQGITIFSEIEFNHSATVQGFKMNLNHIVGIELTAALMLKCGFKRKNFSKQTKDDYWIHDKLPKELTYYLPYGTMSMYISNIPIKYLHQLQNLYFALTGGELIIKL